MKHLFSFLMLGAGLLAVGCSSDDLTQEASSSNEATVTFTVAQPGNVQTRGTYANGLTATTLWYAVYDESGTLVDGMTEELPEKFDATSLETTLTLTLAKGNTYTVFFWAESPDSPYDVTFEGEEASISYAEDATLLSNTDDYDAFYNLVEFTVTGNTAMTVELYRPFAQLNVGASDVDEYEASSGNALSQTKVVVSGIGTSMSLWDGAVEDATQELTFDFNAIPEDETFPYEDEDGEVEYTYLSMNYLLVDAEESTVDVAFYYDETEATEEESTASHLLEVSSVPVRRNYQTNIFGQLLTGSVDFNIVKIPAFEEPDYEFPIVTSEETLLAALANGESAVKFEGDVVLSDPVYLTYDITIDLNGHTLSNASNTALTSETDGVNITIENGTITSLWHGLSLVANDATVTLSNVEIISGAEPVMIGSESMDQSGNNVTITNSELSTDGAYSGVIIQGAPQTVTIENCTISCGYFGIFQNGTIAGSTISVSGSTITATYSGIYLSNATQFDYNTLTVDNCTITSQEESAIEVKKTNLSVTNSTLASNYAGQQSYAYYGGGSNGLGFGIMLAETAGGEGSAYEGEVSLSGNTYTLSATANPNGGDTPWNVAYYSESGLAEYEADGAAE